MATARPLALLAAAALAGGCAHEEAEGRAYVKHVQLSGNHNLEKDEILEHVALDETSWIPFSPKRYLDPVALELDRKRIEALYAAHGYFWARVRSAAVTPNGE